jgi:putative membrane protein
MGTIKQPAAVLATGILLLTGTFAMGQQDTKGEHQKETTESTATTSELSKGDRKFIMKAIDGGMAEVEIGKLAQEKASNDKVKEIGRMLVEDHTKAGTQLQQIASQKGVDLPDEQKENEKKIGKLASLSGEEFDREFLKRQYKHHEQDIRQFERTAEKSDDPDLRKFAANTLPTLQKHRETIRQTAEGMGVQVARNATNGMQTDRDMDRYPADGTYPGRRPGDSMPDSRYPGSTPPTVPDSQSPSTTPRP